MYGSTCGGSLTSRQGEELTPTSISASAVLAHRMIDRIFVDLVGALRLFDREALEGRVKAHRRLMRGVEQLERDLVGGRFLHPGEGGHLRLGDRRARAHDHHAGFAGAQRHRRGAQHHRQQHGDHGVLHAHAGARNMAGRDMAGLMRHHADQLVGIFAVEDDAAHDEDVLAFRRRRRSLPDRPPDTYARPGDRGRPPWTGAPRSFSACPRFRCRAAARCLAHRRAWCRGR